MYSDTKTLIQADSRMPSLTHPNLTPLKLAEPKHPC
jgi:hypothetical protein